MKGGFSEEEKSEWLMIHDDWRLMVCNQICMNQLCNFNIFFNILLYFIYIIYAAVLYLCGAPELETAKTRNKLM